jgi:hypothetical protein
MPAALECLQHVNVPHVNACSTVEERRFSAA